MQSDRGWWCIPAATVGIQIQLPNGLMALLRSVERFQQLYMQCMYVHDSIMPSNAFDCTDHEGV